MSTRMGALDLIAMTLDAGTFESWDVTREPTPLERRYADELEAARLASGTDEAVITGSGSLDGRRVVVIAGEFRFLGGSIGVTAARRIVDALERATLEGLPVLAATVSGGTRMQEGTVAFLQMAKITQAVLAHKAKGLPYLVYLRHPTTGGVYASWGSLGHVTVAETGALIGFLGPKVYRALRGEDFPAGVQVAENLYRHGLVDAVLDARHLRSMASKAIRIISSRADTSLRTLEAPDLPSGVHRDDPWTSVEISRRPNRPGLRTFLLHAAGEVLPLSGTGQGESDKAATVSLATLGGHGVVVVGLDRRAQHDEHLGPGALRQARRGMALAEGLGLPLLTVIDTSGAALSREAEEGGLAGEIARSLSEMLSLRVPTVSFILGEGTGGAALALLPADRVLVARHGWLAPLPPEGASVIRHGDVDHAEHSTRDQRVSAGPLLEDGIVDEIIDERASADEEPEEFCRRARDAVVRHLDRLRSETQDSTSAARHARYRSLGGAG